LRQNTEKNKDAHWSKNAIVYQIYPISFRDSNGDGKGDLPGIIEKIDYLNGSEHSLGINAVWICPFYRSPMADFGYDIEDFTDVDPIFGGMPNFEKLVEELHKRKIKIIIDFVGNHTSDRHKWFTESRSSLDNPKRDWYVWRDGVNGRPPNNWVSVFGGSAWELDTNTNQYYLHSFLKEQPDLNWRNEEVRVAMSGVVDFWVKKGVDGLRIDAFLHFVEDKLLREDPINVFYSKKGDDPYNALLHMHSVGDIRQSEPLTDFIIKTLDRHKDIAIVGEAYLDPKGIHKLQAVYSSDRFTIFNFNFINRKWSTVEYKKIIDEYLLNSPPNFLPNFVFGNHDVDRVATRIGEAEARIAAFLQFTLPGIPFIYYGEEIGMTNTKIPHDALKDIVAKIFSGYHGGRDPERTPMQWDDTPYAGFSTHKPWLPVNDNYKAVNVKHEQNDAESTFSFYKRIIALRNADEVLRHGEYIPISSNSSNVLSFERRLGDVRYFISMNFGTGIEQELLPTQTKKPQIIFSTTSRFSTVVSEQVLELLPFEGYVLKLEPEE